MSDNSIYQKWAENPINEDLNEELFDKLMQDASFHGLEKGFAAGQAMYYYDDAYPNKEIKELPDGKRFIVTRTVDPDAEWAGKAFVTEEIIEEIEPRADREHWIKTFNFRTL